jgi:hypothetical protein
MFETENDSKDDINVDHVIIHVLRTESVPVPKSSIFKNRNKSKIAFSTIS